MRIVAYVHMRRTVGHVSGVGKFVAGAPLALRHLGHAVELVSPSDEFDSDSVLMQLPNRALRYPRRWIEWGGAAIGWPRIDVDGDWLWCPAESYVAVRGARFAVTAHSSDWAETDLPWAREWRYRRLRTRWRLYYKSIQRSGARILSVSDFLKHRLIKTCGIASHRIHVVGHGVDAEYYSPPPFDLSSIAPKLERYVLVVGGLSKYKGGDRVIATAAQLPNVPFVVVGSDEKEDLQYPNVHRCGYRGVEHGLPALYANAAVVLILSRYETFGLPAAEAMAAGSPVIVSNAGALPEVVGDAGSVVDADDSAQVAGLIRDFLRDDQLRTQHVERNRKRAQEFRWERTGQRIIDALQN